MHIVSYSESASLPRSTHPVYDACRNILFSFPGGARCISYRIPNQRVSPGARIPGSHGVRCISQHPIQLSLHANNTSLPRSTRSWVARRTMDIVSQQAYSPSDCLRLSADMFLKPCKYSDCCHIYRSGVHHGVMSFSRKSLDLGSGTATGSQSLLPDAYST